jgi:hypothetical protein
MRSTNPLDFCLQGLLKLLRYSSPFEKGVILHQRNLCARKTIRNGSWTFEKCDTY